MFVFCNRCARAELHQQKRAQKLCSATLNRSTSCTCHCLWKYGISELSIVHENAICLFQGLLIMTNIDVTVLQRIQR